MWLGGPSCNCGWQQDAHFAFPSYDFYFVVCSQAVAVKGKAQGEGISFLRTAPWAEKRMRAWAQLDDFIGEKHNKTDANNLQWWDLRTTKQKSSNWNGSPGCGPLREVTVANKGFLGILYQKCKNPGEWLLLGGGHTQCITFFFCEWTQLYALPSHWDEWMAPAPAWKS